MDIKELEKEFYGKFVCTDIQQPEFAVSPDRVWEWIEEKVSRIELPVKPEICVNTDKLNGDGEYYYNAKLSELFTLNNLIPQLETKVDFVEGEELAQYEVSQIYYIAKERIAINIYLNEY
jgi:hypothetical protein